MSQTIEMPPTYIRCTAEEGSCPLRETSLRQTPPQARPQVRPQVRRANSTRTMRTFRNWCAPYGEDRRSIKEILELLSLRDRKNLLEYYLVPAQTSGFVALLYPDKPRHPQQKYLLTAKRLGSAILFECQ